MQRQAEHFRCKSCITAQPVVCRVRVPALDSADEISWDRMRSDEIKKMRYPVRRDEISDEIGWDLMRSDEITQALDNVANLTVDRIALSQKLSLYAVTRAGSPAIL